MVNRYMTTSFSWLHRAIYGRKHKCHVQLFRIKRGESQHLTFYAYLLSLYMKVHNINARLHWAMGKLVSLPRDFYCWILLAHSNVARKSNVGEYLAESVIPVYCKKNCKSLDKKGQIVSRSLFVNFNILRRELFVLRWSKAKRRKRRTSKWSCVVGEWDENRQISCT